jgi:hypothetical protein
MARAQWETGANRASAWAVAAACGADGGGTWPEDDLFRLEAREMLERLDLRPVSLKHQMLLQLTLILAGIRGLEQGVEQG